MIISPILERKGTLLDLFENETTRKLFEVEIAQRVMQALKLPISKKEATHSHVPAAIDLSQLYLRQTIDSDDARLNVISRATDKVRAKIEELGIKELSIEGIDCAYDVLIIGYHLVGQIWY